MNRAGFGVGARCWTGGRVDRAVAPGPACPLFTVLASSTPALDANPTCRLPSWDAGSSSREQQGKKGRKR
jgi:hypothetical protein